MVYTCRKPQDRVTVNYIVNLGGVHLHCYASICRCIHAIQLSTGFSQWYLSYRKIQLWFRTIILSLSTSLVLLQGPASITASIGNMTFTRSGTVALGVQQITGWQNTHISSQMVILILFCPEQQYLAAVPITVVPGPTIDWKLSTLDTTVYQGNTTWPNWKHQYHHSRLSFIQVATQPATSRWALYLADLAGGINE